MTRQRGVGMRLVFGWRRLGFLILAAGLCLPAHGQSPASSASTASQPTETAVTSTARPPSVGEYGANLVVRLALMDLRQVKGAGPADYQIASSLLGIADSLRPHDPAILRRLVEAAWSAGDEDLVIETSKRLLVVDPGDEVAQLRLIAARVERAQTVEDRQSLYDRFLGPQGQSLSPAIRSRLALDSALLYREQGDETRFVERLSMATTLDGTNKEAAALAVTYYTVRLNDATGRLDLLGNLLYADPMDPNVHLALAHELANAQAFTAALRFHDLASELIKVTYSSVDDEMFNDRLSLSWQAEGPAAVVKVLNTELARARRMDDLAARAASGTTQESIASARTLSPRYELVRLLSGSAAADEETISNAAANLASVVDSDLETIQAVEVNLELVRSERRLLRLMRSLGRFFAGVDVDKAVEETAVVQAEATEEEAKDPMLLAARAMSLLSAGDSDGAIRVLDDAPREGWASMARALAFERAGRPADCDAELVHLAATAPTELAGAWARQQLGETASAAPELNTNLVAAQRFARAVPTWIDDMVRDPRTFMTLEVAPPRSLLDPLERAGLTIKLRNIAPIPLAVGSDRVIGSRFLFVPRLQVGIDAYPGGVPEVVDIDRLLRLHPRQELTFTVYPELWWAGNIQECWAAFPTLVRWRVIQSFRISPGGGKYLAGMYAPGAGGLTTETPLVRRAILPETKRTVDQLAVDVATAPEESLSVTIAAMRALLLGPLTIERRLPTADVETLSRACAQRYPALSAEGRLMMAAALPHARMVRGMAALDEAVLAEADPRVMPLALVSRAVEPTLAIFDRARSSGLPDLVRLADLFAARLQSGVNCYARLRDMQSVEQAPVVESQP